jgi:hypothetical protein
VAITFISCKGISGEIVKAQLLNSGAKFELFLNQVEERLAVNFYCFNRADGDEVINGAQTVADQYAYLSKESVTIQADV